MIVHQYSAEHPANNNEEIPYDLSYDDLEDIARSCGVTLPDGGLKNPDEVFSLSEKKHLGLVPIHSQTPP